MGAAWVHLKGVANILSFHNIQDVNDLAGDYFGHRNKHIAVCGRAFASILPIK